MAATQTLGATMTMTRKAAELGKLAVRMTTKAGSGHPSSALSLAHIVTELMYRQMRFDPVNPWHAGADRLVLSEGHAVPIVYAAWADLGGAVGKTRDRAHRLTCNEVDQLRALDSELDGHPNPAEGFPFFDAATGSLGMGLSVAAGLALAARLDQSPRRVYCLCGDGESREGQIWEAIDFIVDHRLHHVCGVFNCNGQGQAGLVSEQQSAERLAAKLRAFGCEAPMIDGHDPKQVADAFARFGKSSAPLMIVAMTIKGWGVAELQKGNWHGKPLTEAQLPAAEESLDLAADQTSPHPAGTVSAPARPAEFLPRRVEPASLTWPSFAEAMEAAGLGTALKKQQLATRRAYGAALRTAGDLLPQVVVLDADVSNSTFSEYFGAAHRERFFECKIAEQNMVSCAAGLSAAGYIPFVNSFSKFIARAYDQVELACISRANIKLVGSHSGISLAADGPSQMSVADVAFFRAFTTVRADDRVSPLGWVLQPADAVAAYALTRLMVETPGLCYMRTFRPDVPLLYEAERPFELRGLHVLSQGPDLAIVASGFMVHVARTAMELLARQGIRATLIDAYCLPLDADKLTDAILRSGGRALVVEDNYGGGLGAAVAEVAAANGRFTTAIRHVNRMPKSAREATEILDYCGVSAQQIADHALVLARS